MVWLNVNKFPHNDHARTKFYGPNEAKQGPIKALNLQRDPKGDQRWTKQLERKKIKVEF